MDTPPENFIKEAEEYLGKANGNVYHCIPGIDGYNDGRLMIRLKKKRFVVLDYSMVPSESDIALADSLPYAKIPSEAGKRLCNKNGCNKIGIPLCLYDSDPTEPDPLYLRSGLCFQCQRNLNEERRTERKRGPQPAEPSMLFAIGPQPHKKFKIGKKTIHLKDDAIIINGSVSGTKHYGEGYGFQEIGSDLVNLANQAADDTNRLIQAVSSDNPSSLGHGLDTGKNGGPAPGDDINALYQKAFQAMNKTIFLLSQWRSAWDAAISAATETVADASLADAVALSFAASAVSSNHTDSSAVAAATAAAVAHEPSNPNIESLLLAADKSHEHHQQFMESGTDNLSSSAHYDNSDLNYHHSHHSNEDNQNEHDHDNSQGDALQHQQHDHTDSTMQSMGMSQHDHNGEFIGKEYSV